MFRYFFLILALAAHALPAEAQETSTSAPTATLLPGDLIRVDIWREAELSGQFPIDPEGNVTLPLLGRTRVVGIPFSQIADSLIALYSEQLRNPSITVVPLRRIYVLGDVSQPGVYTVEPTATLAAVVAMAGGPSGVGDPNKIRLVRDGETILERIPMGEAIHVVDIRSEDQVYVGRIHWVRRNVPYLVGMGFTLYGLMTQIFN